MKSQLTAISKPNGTSLTTNDSNIKPNSIHVQGDAVFHGNITWQDRDMREWFEKIESRLAILQTNPKIEDEWNDLKELGDQYRALEKNLVEQQKIFNILKDSKV